MEKLRYVFEQVMITDGTRQLPDTSIRETFKVCVTMSSACVILTPPPIIGCRVFDQVHYPITASI